MELFNKVLAFLSEKVKNSEIFIIVSPPFDVNFQPIDARLVKEGSEKLGISEQDFKKRLSTIESLLLAILQDGINEYIVSRIKHDIEAEHIAKDAGEEKAQELKKQAETVEKSFISERLKQRFQLKAMSKSPFFSGLEWDIKLKTADSSGETIRFPYATFRIRFQREYTWEPHLLLGGRAFDSVQMNLCKEELYYLQILLRKSIDQINTLEEQYGINN